MGLLTFSINVTLDGCVDHQEAIADDETHAFFTRLMDEGGAMLWGRVTYEILVLRRRSAGSMRTLRSKRQQREFDLISQAWSVSGEGLPQRIGLDYHLPFGAPALSPGAPQ